VLKTRRDVLRPAIVFQIWSTLIFAVSFAPAAGWLLNRLVTLGGQYAVSDHDLIAFFLTVPGVLLLVLGISFVLAFWFAEQVALLLIIDKAHRGDKVTVSLVIWEQLGRLPALFRLGLFQAGALLVVGIPFGLGIWLTYHLLLGEWDLYFYINVRPPSWWIALAIGGTLSATYLALATWLHYRWMLAVPALVLGNATPREALRRSWTHTRGRFWQFGLPIALGWIVVLTASLATTLFIRMVAGQLLDQGETTLRVLAPFVIGALILITFFDLLWFLIGKILHVMLLASYYIGSLPSDNEPTRPAPAGSWISPRGLRRLGWLTVIVAVVMGTYAGAAFLERLYTDRPVATTGHRGSKIRAPENTLSALRHAIAEGADYAEIDVQTTADGVVVLLHDGDLMRVASVDRRIDEIDYEALRVIDVGSWFAPEFAGERIATLQEAIDLARGRIRLNIELKFTRPDPILAAEVGRIVKDNGFTSECVVSSLNFEALKEIQQTFPELTTGLIVFQSIGDLSRMEADFLSINAARATPRLVSQAHSRGRAVHVWTVNDIDNALAMFEMGVDNIITDYPAAIREYREDWDELSIYQRIALMLRNLVMDIDRPEPAEL
jgi:glycerophosphoryl diester phosphodiesterase